MNTFEEIKKCHDDFVYFAETYLKIRNPKKGIIPVKLYDFQKRLIKTYEDQNYVIAVKFRQGGFTTFTAFYALWKCLFSLDQRWLFIAKTDREAIGIGKIIQDAVDHLPQQFKAFLTKSNDHEKRFDITNSTIRCFAIQAAPGMAGNVVIDEAAFIPGMDSHWNALYPTISTGHKCFALSTTNGVGNWFEETWRNAVKKINSFYPLEVSYTEHPEYNNPEWVEQVKKNLGPKAFAQEIEGQFISTHNAKWHTKQQKKQMLIKMICELFDDDDDEQN